MAAKVAGTAFLAVLVPVYLRAYGPTNFLWFCDAALILTVAGMWLENSLLISMCSVGILVPQCLWLADFGSNLLGFHLLGLTGYMFDHRLPLFTRGLSLFHGWLPLLLVWLLLPWAMTNGVCPPGLAWPPVWCSSAIFLPRPPALI